MESVGQVSLADSRPAKRPGVVAGDLVRAALLLELVLVAMLVVVVDDVEERRKSVVSRVFDVEDVDDFLVGDLSGDRLGDRSGEDRDGEDRDGEEDDGPLTGDLAPLVLDVVVTRVVMILLVGDLVVVVVVTFSVSVLPVLLELDVVVDVVRASRACSTCPPASRRSFALRI